LAHFAQVDENNQVIQVIVVSNEDIKDVNGIESEEIGIGFCKKILGSNTNWIQTSYNSNFRVRYAGIGYSYNESLNAFVPPKPYDSWILNNDAVDWQSPIGLPPKLTEEQIASKSFYKWEEESYQVDNTTGWILVTPQEIIEPL
jgi:hypothetical protein